MRAAHGLNWWARSHDHNPFWKFPVMPFGMKHLGSEGPSRIHDYASSRLITVWGTGMQEEEARVAPRGQSTPADPFRKPRLCRALRRKLPDGDFE